MWRRIAPLAILLCAGCASTSGDHLLQDSLWGDVASLFGMGDEDAGLPPPRASVGTAALASPAAAAPTPDETPANGANK